MKLLALCATGLSLMLSFTSCTNNKHLISDAAERNAVQQDFETRRSKLSHGDLFQVFEQPMSDEQREALTFLYAYMPLGDITDYSGEYYLENIDYSLKAREEMPWGKTIPEREFRHFVLPVRVNNENLDDSRKVFYEELKDRVKGLSLHDAVLEVNHWCHEKVIYTPSDARTSSPLASVKTAYGRCGEESTFTVAALRSVGIPARQVYTPRWAHTDDNHAWVEAWVDGKWHFFGACEPEPVLDLGWFNAPASRGMLMHTKVFGRYNGPEEVMYETPNYTEINVIDNYAPTAKAEVTVVDAEGNPVTDAKVEFKVYNYAEFYTVARKQTDTRGKTFLTAGKGDMLVWASKDGKFGYSKLSFGKDNNLTVKLDKTAGDNYMVEVDIVPPAEGVNMPEVTPEQRAGNNRRMAQEDSIRNAYVATFMSDESARNFAKEYKLDEEAVAKILVASRGNHLVIRDFLARLRSDKSKKGGIDLLQRISSKDLRDVSLEVLVDHMQSRLCENAEYFRRFVRNPRVSNEMLTPYKSFFGKVVSKQDMEAFRADPMKLASWVADSIQVDNNCNLGGAPISPAGVWRARVADAHSRDIFFVSMARSMGIPARIDEVTGKVQLIIGDERPVDVQVIGNFNSESLYKPIDSDELKSILSTTGRGYYIVAVLGAGQEPTNHALRDIAALSKDFEQWGRSIVLLFPNEEQFKKFRPEEFPGLPSTITYGIDADGAIQKQIAEGMKLPNKTILPMFIIGDTFNRVVFVSQGYTIGLGEQLMKVIHKL